MGPQKTPEEILKEAAAAAADIIPSLEKRRDEAQKLAASLQSQVGQLYAIVSAARPSGSMSGITFNTPQVTSTSSTTVASLDRAVTFTQVQAPTAEQKIAVVLDGSMTPLSVKSIAEEIEKKFGQAMPPSTVYAALATGKKSGRFSEKNGMWTITKGKGQ